MNDSTQQPMDRELLDEFYIEFKQAKESCEDILLELEYRPDDQELIDALFRYVHTIKGNLLGAGLQDLSPLVQNVEGVLDKLRGRTIHFDSVVSDLLLLALDFARSQIDHLLANQPIKADRLQRICRAIAKVGEDDETGMQEDAASAVRLMDPGTRLSEDDLNREDGLAEILQKFQVPVSGDLDLFTSLIGPLDNRSPYWTGRTFRMLSLSLAMNKQAGTPVDPAQLAAAVIMHDLGMSFMPLQLLHKSGGLSGTEKCTLHSHLKTGHDLLHRLGDWEEAAETVLQHHERVDGCGYTRQLTEMEICDGAKILAIADTFEARTHERAYRVPAKRPLVRAILELNKCAGSQFSQYWIDVFNEVIRQGTHLP
jgi:HD-GYP domain-containing protein (c-di-GMP phosphodiesterase class II)